MWRSHTIYPCLFQNNNVTSTMFPFLAFSISSPLFMVVHYINVTRFLHFPFWPNEKYIWGSHFTLLVFRNKWCRHNIFCHFSVSLFLTAFSSLLILPVWCIKSSLTILQAVLMCFVPKWIFCIISTRLQPFHTHAYTSDKNSLNTNVKLEYTRFSTEVHFICTSY